MATKKKGFLERATKASELESWARPYWKEIKAADERLDALCPGWDEPYGDGIRGTAGAKLPPEILGEVKRLLKIRQLRYNGYSDDVFVSFCVKTGKPTIIVKAKSRK